jgi:phage/plasmid-like protein (TIGR03299 family)
MAHMIMGTDRYGEVRKNGQRAWHGLGSEIEEGLGAEEAFKVLGLDWNTELAPLTATMEDGTQIPLKGRNPYRAHLRSDTKDLLGLVTDSYQPFQNSDLARFADAIAGQDAAVTVETAGSLYNSRRVFVLVKLPKLIIASADDVLEQYILVQNGHGGTATAACYDTAIRVCCANTLAWSERNAGGIKFQHTGDFENKVKQAQTVLGLAIGQADKFQDKVTALVGKTLTAEGTHRLLEGIYDATYGTLPEAGQVAGEVIERLTLKRTNLIEQWEVNLCNERQKLRGIRGTAWAALNAVTEFHDHDRGNFGGIEESDARVSNNIFGASSRDKATAMKVALAAV